MKKKLSIVLAVVMLFVLLVGCGSSSTKAESANDSAMVYTNAETITAETPAQMYFGGSTGYSTSQPDPEPVVEATEDLRSESALQNAKLIYTADMDMETTEFDIAVERLGNLVDEIGGYFESSNINSRSTYRSASYTIRVPAENFDSFCDRVGQLCQVLSKNRYAEDISEKYYDTESRLVTQQTKLKRLQELLKGAENMEDIITIETAISETELTIENLTGTLRRYDSLVGYSTVYLSIDEVYKITDVEEPVIGFGAKFVEALKTGCRRFVNDLEYMALTFARNWISWVIFIAIAAAVIVVLRKKGIRLHRRKNYDVNNDNDAK